MADSTRPRTAPARESGGALPKGAATMKAAVAGADGERLLPLIRKIGFEINEDRPDVVIAYGGDGTLLGSERDWPTVPKIAIRHDDTTTKCPDHDNEKVLRRLANGEVSQTTLVKLEATAKGQRLLGINDIALHHHLPTSGVRFRVWINDQAYSGEIVGDGLVVSTPFGSTAYYRSITRSFFRSGIGIAFNNTTEQVDHLVLGEDERLRVVVTRGPAVLCADNSPLMIDMQEGDEVRVAMAPERTVLLEYETLLCNKCKRLDGVTYRRLGGLMSM
jgi:NAD+ kinase